ncbi:mannonate dehydratase [Coraliomargarita algicola]|uniref:mannonate dehydratase n=1 Tax=Coraliomargarita algicola TaxID=3092156 RepID=A0ABZ0RI30_9BACT|nr:mannonate dehydratase [Coraliomargarita sp. J2-16]WPJ94851.1 mannonate dehydratase [Coraliomargarita sp. J2-16]
MILTDFLPAQPDRSWQLAKQIGINHAICKCAPELTKLAAPDNLTALRTIKDRFTAAGIRLYGLEGDEFDMQRIKLGLPGRDADIARYQQMLRNMGQLEIPLLCYNFMASIGWFRTDPAVPIRGGAISNRFRLSAVETKPIAPELQISESALWENYRYFIEAVHPIAEAAGVQMGLHPDDPPLSPLRGVGRIFNSADAFEKAMSLSSSPAHGITYCQANFRAMGEDIFSTAERFAKRIVFVHFRDVEGTREDFTETFHDNGPTDMAAILAHYHALGFNGPIRVDHVPSMAGEENAPHGYAQLGRLFAVGYLKGILDAHHIQYC